MSLASRSGPDSPTATTRILLSWCPRRSSCWLDRGQFRVCLRAVLESGAASLQDGEKPIVEVMAPPPVSTLQAVNVDSNAPVEGAEVMGVPVESKGPHPFPRKYDKEPAEIPPWPRALLLGKVPAWAMLRRGRTESMPQALFPCALAELDAQPPLREASPLKGSCVPCWLFFLLGWVFTLLFMNEVATQGTDIFSFEDPAVETDLKVQQYFGFQAALDETPGCGDQAHKEQAVCEADELCEWVQRGPSASCRPWWWQLKVSAVAVHMLVA
eukprot:s1266_g6.t1